jgi:hypothetical protein
MGMTAVIHMHYLTKLIVLSYYHCRAKQLEGHQPSLNEIKQARTSLRQVAEEPAAAQ